MQSMRYGAIPLATRVGGLVDTIHDLHVQVSAPLLSDDPLSEANLESDETVSWLGDGFLADAPTTEAISEAMERLLELWSIPQQWNQARHRALQRDFSWDESAHCWSTELTTLM